MKKNKTFHQFYALLQSMYAVHISFFFPLNHRILIYIYQGQPCVYGVRIMLSSLSFRLVPAKSHPYIYPLSPFFFSCSILPQASQMKIFLHTLFYDEKLKEKRKTTVLTTAIILYPTRKIFFSHPSNALRE